VGPTGPHGCRRGRPIVGSAATSGQKLGVLRWATLAVMERAPAGNSESRASVLCVTIARNRPSGVGRYSHAAEAWQPLGGFDD